MKAINAENRVSIRCRILREDFDKSLYFEDSGMFDITTHNPVAIALKRVIGKDHKIQIVRSRRDGPYLCIIDGRKYQPSTNLEPVLESAEHGIYLKDFSFDLVLPRSIVSTGESTQKEMIDNQSVRGHLAA